MDETIFWHQLQLPIIGLSPMDGVTDQPFRYIQKKYGNPVVMYTEFTSTEGVCHGADRLLKDFLYDETQRPLVAQIYGTTPDYFRQTTILLCELGFDGIDINMGCPAKNVAHSGAGAALIKTPQLAQDIIRAVQQGITEWQNGHTVEQCADITPKIAAEIKKRHQQLPEKYQQKRAVPVSVKTRVGFNEPVIKEWISNLLECEPVVIALHGRTLTQHYSGEASWEKIAEAAELTKNTNTLLLGNGDILSLADAHEHVQKYNVDGVLIGRGSMGNPYVFKKQPDGPSIFEIALEHCREFEKVYGNDEIYNFLPMRKHLGWYVRAVPNATEIRVKLFQTNNSQEVEQVLRDYSLIG